MLELFKIGALVVEVSSPFEVPIVAELTPFRIENSSSPDVTIEVLPQSSALAEYVDTLETIREGVRLKLFQDKDSFYGKDMVIADKTIVVLPKNQYKKMYFHMHEGVAFPQRLFSFFFSVFLADNNAFFLHASLVRWQGLGVLFTAPSGTGKSTQADLWKIHGNADIINGDRVILRRISGEWQAYGSPWAGASQIYRAEQLSPDFILTLEQAKENRLDELSRHEIVKRIVGEVILPRWYAKASEKTLATLITFIMESRILRLSCLPDRSAVELVMNYIRGEKAVRGEGSSGVSIYAGEGEKASDTFSGDL